jgi:spore germination cell wall hydrolase CwlJ-like protein
VIWGWTDKTWEALPLKGKTISAIFVAGLAVTGCSTANQPDALDAKATPKAKTKTVAVAPSKVTYNYTAKDRECLKRAMYFESEHSDRDGYMAVGTVVMNRLTSQAYSDSICGVVGQKKQFAPGVLTRTVEPVAEPQLDAAADDILRGARHPGVREAMFFHTEGLKFPYGNMHYVTAAGGNVFYEKRGRDGELQTAAPMPSYEVAMNYVANDQRSGAVQFAGVEQYTAAPQPAPAAPAVGAPPPSTQVAYTQVASADPDSPAPFEILLPETGPVPAPMPGEAAPAVAFAPASTASLPQAPQMQMQFQSQPAPQLQPAADVLTPPARVVLPTPRPAYNSAELNLGPLRAGG